MKNIPLKNNKFVPLVSRAHRLIPRSYISSDQITDIAIKEYEVHKKGLIYRDLIEKGLAKNKRQAQRILKHHRRKETLFTISDKRPQIYYPICLRSEIHKNILKNTPVNPLGVSPLVTTRPPLFPPSGGIKSKHPLSQCFEYMADYTLEGYVLPLLSEAPLLVHNLHFKTKIIPECYSELNLSCYKKNGGKQHEEIIGKTKITYVLYSSGTVVIHTTCSNYPFRVDMEEDRLKLIGYFGQIRAGLINLLNDRHERIVPDISEWEVTECDFNKDIKVGDFLHMTALKIRIKHLDHLLGIYVKAMGQSTVFRVEETKRPSIRVTEFITDTFNPTERLWSEMADQRRQINEIYHIVSKLFAPQNFTEEKSVNRRFGK
jgi:hypothetical protein